MPEINLLDRLNINRKDFWVVFILLFNAFTWHYLIHTSMIPRILDGFTIAYVQTLVWVVYYITIIGSGLVGLLLSSRIRRLHFLYLWITLGAITSLFAIPLQSTTITNALSLTLLWGVSFGLGIPSCLAYFADCTLVENRGRVGGITFIVINISFPLIVMLSKVDFAMISIISAMWRGLGLIILFLLKPSEKIAIEKKRGSSVISIFHNKAFILYLVPWFMFCLVDRFEKSVLEHFLSNSMPDVISFVGVVEPIIGSFFILIAGLLSDWIGRKRMVLYGFIALGFAYAIIGIAPSIFVSWYFYSIIDGAAWGIFSVIFILILWGDLSQPGTRKEYYIIGSIPFFLSSVIPSLLAPSFIELIPPYAAFSLASFFLFVAVLPLMYAPETLPERKIKLRQLRKYVEGARKVKEKHEGKSVRG
jgi:hypothetical protein